MRQFISGVVAALVTGVAILLFACLIVLPRLDWGARESPSPMEAKVANRILARWIARNASSATNPLSLTPENLKSARTEYEEHCAACHGLDGTGRNQFEADFHPPVAKLSEGAENLSDSEIYFIVANGVRYTAMPAFGRNHSTGDIWEVVLWVRHLANLSAEERAEITREMQSEGAEHQKTMEH